MTHQEAKFLLSAYRANGGDAGDPTFAEALALAENDPALRAWFEREHMFDSACAAKLREIAPPAGLREAILTGARASRRPRSWWTQPVWMAAAAAIVIAAVVGVRSFTAREDVPGIAMLASFGIDDYLEAHDDHEGHPPALAGVQARLVSAPLPLTRSLPLDFTELKKLGCRTVRFGRAEIFEVCFYRNGVWYHLYATPRGNFAPSGADPRATILARGGAAAATWADAKGSYALVTSAGADALRQLL
jgi:hypothetical protein